MRLNLKVSLHSSHRSIYGRTPKFSPIFQAGVSGSIRANSTKSDGQSIGFIGLGQMGHHMANNIYSKLEQPLVVYDNGAASVERFISGKETKRITIASSPGEVASLSSVVITMLPASEHVQEVYFGENGMSKFLKPGTLFIDSSTIDPLVSRELGSKLQMLNCSVVDAPVSGGILGAEAGTLTFMVGSHSIDTFNFAKKYLSLMGKNIVHCGAIGNGQVAKICNNMLLGIGMIGTAEVMNLGQKLGMDPKLLASILNTSSGRCWASDTYNPCPGVQENVPSSRDYSGGFGVRLMAKDLGLAVAAANSVKANVVLGSLSHQLYTLLSKSEGFENKDFSSVFKWLDGKPAATHKK